MYGAVSLDVSGLLGAVYTLQKVALGLPVLALAFTLARVFLWALLTPVCGRQAGLVAGVMTYCAAFLLLVGGHGVALVEWASGVASRLLGVGLGPGFPGLDGVARGAADAFSSAASALATPGW